ncbi:MAG: secretin N-terminal domain-containing protein [Candidatus Firestonebacteria bacterium]
MKKINICLIAAGALFFTACSVNKDIIKTMQEPETTVTTQVQGGPEVKVEKESAKDTGSMIISAAPPIYIPYKKFPDLQGVDWSKKISFSFKEEDITKLLEFLAQSSGITIVNNGGDVPSAILTDPQTQQLKDFQPQGPYAFQAAQQQQQKPAEPTKKIGPASGNVTVYSKGQVTLDEAFKIMDVVLLGKGYSSVFTGNVMKVVPLSGIRQTNLKIVVNNDPALAQEGDDVVMQIVPLKNLTAAKLRLDLSSMIPLWGMILSNDAANSLIMVNSLSNIKTLLTIIDTLEKTSTRSMSVKVFPLKFGGAWNLASILTQVFTGSTSVTAAAALAAQRGQQFGAGSPQQAESVTIVAENTSNSIVAVASPQTMNMIKSTLEQLDVKQSQVLVEVLIVDVTLNSEFQMGVEWNLPGTPVLNGNDYTGTLKSDFQLGQPNIPAFSYTLLRGDTKAFLKLLMKQTKVDVKAAPRILTLDNQRATVNVGQKVPNLTGSQTTSSGQVIYTYNYNNVGTILNVTPRINKDNYITMSIDQTVSKITESTYFGAPVIDNRQATTSVRVKNGETMVLGGIITDSTSITEYKIPILGDIPLIGFLFNSTSRTTQKTELMMFLTPYVIENAKESGEHIRQMNQKIENLK